MNQDEQGVAVDSIESITRLIHRYCELIDAGDIDAYVAQFAHGRMGDREVGDTESLRAWITNNMVFYDGNPRTKHLTTNVVVEVDEDADTATARSYVTLLHAAPGHPVAVGGCAEYHDRFHRVDGTWRWTDRQVRNRLDGQTTGHMRLAAADPQPLTVRSIWRNARRAGAAAGVYLRQG